MPHLHDELPANSESDVAPTLRDKQPQDHQQSESDGNHIPSSCETEAVDRLLSLAATATQHAPPRETEPSNESPNVVGTKAAGVGNQPTVTPSPLNALHRPAHQRQHQQQQQWMGSNQLPNLFHYHGPMYSVYHGSKAIVSSPIRGRSPATNNNDNDEEHLATTTPKKPVLQKSENEQEDEGDRCASPPRTRKITTLDRFHRYHHAHHHQYLHNMVPVHGSMILPQSPIHHQRIRNGQPTSVAGPSIATPPFHWSVYPPHHAYHPYMATNSFPPTTMHPDANSNVSSKRTAPPEEREDIPNAKRRLSLPVDQSARIVSGDSQQSSSREESGTSDEPQKDESSVSKNDMANEDEIHNETLASKRVEAKDKKQRVISPSSSNDGGKEEDDEFSNSTTSCIPPRVEFGTRGVSASNGAPPSYPPPPPIMPHPVHHARTMRGPHAMYSPFHHHHHHHPAMHMGYPPAGFGPPPPQFGMHPSGWYTMGPPSGPTFPYSALSQMGSTQPPSAQPLSSSSQNTSRASSPVLPAKTIFPHREPPLSPVRSPNRDVEEVTPSSLAEERKEAKSAAATNPQPVSCPSQATSSEFPTKTTSSQSIKSVADWQKAAIATGMAPSANRCVPLKAPMPTKYWGESSTAKDIPLPDFHRLVNFPDYLTKSRPNQVEGGGVVQASKSNGQRHCVMCGTLRLSSASTSHLVSNQRSNRKKGAGAAGDDEQEGGKKGSVLPMSTHIIPRQNKGLCTACDVTVWVVTESGTEIKWCKGCKNFRPWIAFGDKGLATKCVRCRDRQREKYALQKEESGRFGRRQSQQARATPESPLVHRRESSTLQQQQQQASGVASNQEDGGGKEDAEHVEAARGLRNLMAASI